MTKKILLTLLGIITLLQIHNLLSYPVKKGLDAPNHIDYINFIKTEKRVPLPNEGWEFYQTPLYYALASLFPTILSVKIMGFVSWILLIFISYIFFAKRIINENLTILGVLIVASVPVIIYLTPAIGNEFFSGVMISICLIYYLNKSQKISLKVELIFGLLLGLALLSKATSFIFLVAVLINEILNYRGKVMKAIHTLLIPFGIAILLAGWFYMRNIIIYKNPFISSIDFSQFKIHQVPGYRDFKFFTDLSGFLKLDLYHSHFYSFWSGTYFSWFYDGHNALVPVQNYSKAGILLTLLSLPIFFISIYGFIREIKLISNKNRLLIIYPLLLFLSYIFYNFKLPFYSTVKGVFLVSLVVPFGYFILKGIEQYKKYLKYITFYFAFYILVLVRNFWIIPSWYKQ